MFGAILRTSSTRSIVDPLDVDVDSAPPFRLSISGEAVDRIYSEGGRIFIWSEPMGAGVRDSVSASPPHGLLFESYRYAKRDVDVWVGVPTDFPFEKLTIELRRWPFKGYVVRADGKRWGWRGDPWNAT